MRSPIDHALIAKALEQGILDGKTIAEIADALTLAPKILRHWMLSDVPPEFRHVQELCFHARIIEADTALDRAKDHADIAKRTSQAKLARFDAERRLPRLWGAKQELTVIDKTPPPDLTEVARRVAYIQAMAGRSRLPAAYPPAAPAALPAPAVDAASTPPDAPAP